MTKTDQKTSPTATPPENSQGRVLQFMQQLQDEICQTLEALDGGSKFKEDSWEREEGGGGRSRVLREGRVFEQGGVNFSEIYGDHLPPSILQQRPEAEGHGFFVTGTSMVLHPRSPYIPTVHLNYRYFEAGPVWWFGGGADLTPYYPFAEDAAHFHRTLKQACDKHHPSITRCLSAGATSIFTSSIARRREEWGAYFSIIKMVKENSIAVLIQKEPPPATVTRLEI